MPIFTRSEEGEGTKAAKIAVKHGVEFNMDRRRFVSAHNPIACEEAQAELDEWKRRRELRIQRSRDSF